ncbi:MAG: 5'-nucleotidase C-terminal domain-containing protein, partial [Firmicutes bacterium]|nr:5'-nucleotidase C-terminal domain-containing protein [Bacillota bacterium]
IQGTAYGSMDDGATIIELMNAAGYDLATLGNHEFDYGMNGCLAIVEQAEYPYVSANFYHEADGVRGETVLNSYELFVCGDKTIAIVGITTPETFTKSTPAYFQDENGNYIYGIAGGDDGAALYADVQAAIDEAKAAGATTVIALGHLGDEIASAPWTSEETIANVSGLAAFIDGHSHSTVEGKMIADESGANVLLTQTGEYFNRIGMMVIDGETGAITTDFIEYEENADGSYQLVSDLYSGTEMICDAEVKAIKDAWISEINTQLGQLIGSTQLTLNNYDEQGNRLVRLQETNSGDFCADALYYLFDSMDMDVDAAIMNGGGVRNKAITGDISYLTCKEIHTFGNVACLQTVTGQQLLDALEWGARSAGDSECGGFLQVSGITYKINTAIPDTTQKDDKGVWIGGPTGEYRVYDVKVYNKENGTWDALDLDARYNLAGYNYTLRELGDGFAMFGGAVNVLDYVMEDYMVLSNYVSAFEDGCVEATNSPLASKYAGFTVDYGTVNGSGRIVVEVSAEDEIIIGGLDNDVWFSKYGNVYVSCETEDFLTEFAMGDLVTVRFLDQELVLPVVPDYFYVDSGKAAIVVKDEVGLAVNMGSFGEKYGLGTKVTDAEGNWYWEAAEGVSYPVKVEFEMAEEEGYLAEYLQRQLEYTNDRDDYSHLSDEEFANFRMIDTTGIIDGRLYRTSSPINPKLGRNTYAMAALENAGVTVIMNLADSMEIAEGYEGYEDSYYAEQNVVYLNLGIDITSEDFKAGLAEGLRFFAENKGVYAIHCTEGKDRAGFVSALLECLMGASVEEVIEDYMLTYCNYYGVEPDSEKYNAIAQSNIVKSLCNAFDVTDLDEVDLAAEAAEYILGIGLSEDELERLQDNLGKEFTYTVKLNGNGASYDMAIHNIASGDSVNDAFYEQTGTAADVGETLAPSRQGYRFAGWFTATGEQYDFDAPVTKDINLYAMWETVYVDGVNALLTPNGEGWSYDEQTNTLTLAGVNITNGYAYVEDCDYLAGIYILGDLNIVLAEGTDNQITIPGAEVSYGILAEGDLNISGGKLTVTSGDALYESAGIMVYGDLVIRDSDIAVQSGMGGGDSVAGGIDGENITIENSRVAANSAYAGSSCGIYTDGQLLVKASEVSAYAQKAGDSAVGITAFSGLISVESEICAQSGSVEDAEGVSLGICADIIDLTGGRMDVISEQDGIYIGDSMVITDAVVDVDAGANGIRAEWGSINIECTKVTPSTQGTPGLKGTQLIVSAEGDYAVFAGAGLEVSQMLTVKTPAEGAVAQSTDEYEMSYWTIVDGDGKTAKSITIGPLQYMVRIQGLSYAMAVPVPAGQAITQAYGEAFEERLNTTKEGYTFAGWYMDEAYTAGNKFSFDMKITEDITIYAKWIDNKTAPPTGDESNIMLWSAVMCVCAAGLIAVVKNKKIKLY